MVAARYTFCTLFSIPIRQRFFLEHSNPPKLVFEGLVIIFERGEEFGGLKCPNQKTVEDRYTFCTLFSIPIQQRFLIRAFKPSETGF